MTGLTNVEMDRNSMVAPLGRFRAVRPGSVTGLVVTSEGARSDGTLTVTVFKSTNVLADQGGTTTSFSATLDATNTSRHFVTQDEGDVTFLPGEELYLVVTTSTGIPQDTWGPVGAEIRCALEIED